MSLLAVVVIILTALYSAILLAILTGMFRLRQGENKQLYRVSVLVAARNEEKNIGHLLRDLMRQTYPADLYEVIVASDGSSDKTDEIVQNVANEHPNVKLIVISQCPPGFSPKKHAVEAAFRQSNGDIILATDADCMLEPRWIETMVSYFSPTVGFVVGFSQFGRPEEQQNILERLQAFDFLQLMCAAAGTCNLGFPLAASGQNLGYRRQAFLEVGGYSKVAHRISGDDVLLLQLVRTYTKWKILFASAPDAFAASAPISTLSGFFNQRKRWASNGSYQIRLNIPFFFYLLLVFLYSTIMLIGLPLSIITGTAAGVFMAAISIKLVMEGLVALRGAAIFKRKDLVRYFPMWFLLQIPYIVVIGLLGTFTNFKWKDRDHGAAAR
jgi:cellulose synthase/poly-beta-1,6-N-acetylglucosamine synthase-like glycosyltransferase